MEIGLKGGEKLKAHLDGLARKLQEGASVNVGFLEGATYPDGTSVPMVAAIQNFGAPSQGIPPRPFFSNMVEKESDHWGNDTSEALKHADYDAARAMDFMGMQISDELRQSIVDLSDPALSKVTVLLRQRFGNNTSKITFADVQQARRDIANGEEPSANSKPLVWTGNLLNSVDYEVKTEKSGK